MTKRELYRAEARAWRKAARNADRNIARGVCGFVSTVETATRYVNASATQRVNEHARASPEWFLNLLDPARVLACLFLALEAEDDARRAVSASTRRHVGMERAMSDFRPFASGVEYRDWRARNCDTCDRDVGRRRMGEPPTCPLAHALGVAALADGRIGAPIALEYGGRREPYDMLPMRCDKWTAAGRRVDPEAVA